MALPKEQPTSSEPMSPGPWQSAMAESSPGVRPPRASSTTGHIISMCLRDASSGTMPPYFAWISSWLDTMFESTRTLPSKTSINAAEVSSQEVSMPRTNIYFMAWSLLLTRPFKPSSFDMVRKVW